MTTDMKMYNNSKEEINQLNNLIDLESLRQLLDKNGKPTEFFVKVIIELYSSLNRKEQLTLYHTLRGAVQANWQ